MDTNSWPLLKNSMIFFFFFGGGGWFSFFIFLFLNVCSNQCSQMGKGIFLIARNICLGIDFSWNETKHFSISKSKFSRIFYEGIVRKKIFRLFFADGGRLKFEFFLILDTWWNYYSQLQKQFFGLLKTFISPLVIDLSPNIVRKGFDVEELAEMIVFPYVNFLE